MPLTRLPTGLAPGHPAAWLATWFFSGLLPYVPGSWGTLAALPFAWAIAVFIHPWALLPAAGVAFVAGLWAARVYLAHGAAHDPGAIVIDEVAGIWLTLAVVAPEPLLYFLGFVFFRAADILKPWPCGWVDRNVAGALGVMADDILAGIYAGTLLWLVDGFFLPYLDL